MPNGKRLIRVAIAVVMLCVLLPASGCVKRQIIITSKPAGAKVYLGGREVGKTPVSIDFEFYGVREIALRKSTPSTAGYYYLAKVEKVDVAAPWYEYFPIDLIPDVVLPFTIHDRHEFHFVMERCAPKPEDRDKLVDGLLEKADKLRKATRGGGRKGGGGDE